jgi:hypothetical protein
MFNLHVKIVRSAAFYSLCREFGWISIDAACDFISREISLLRNEEYPICKETDDNEILTGVVKIVATNIQKNGFLVRAIKLHWPSVRVMSRKTADKIVEDARNRREKERLERPVIETDFRREYQSYLDEPSYTRYDRSYPRISARNPARDSEDYVDDWDIGGACTTRYY